MRRLSRGVHESDRACRRPRRAPSRRHRGASEVSGARRRPDAARAAVVDAPRLRHRRGDGRRRIPRRRRATRLWRRVGVVHNARFASTNSLYSLWLARDLLADGFVVLNSDVLFARQLLDDLLTARYDDALLVAARGADDYSDEEMKVRIRGGRVVAISKSLDPAEADGENIGDRQVQPGGRGGAGRRDEPAGRRRRRSANGCPAAFAAFCRRRPLWAIESRGFPWIEIDFPEDYWRACGDILPAIDVLDNRRPQPPIVARAATAAASGRTLHHV